MNQCGREGCEEHAKNKYCSRSCAAKVNNRKYKKRSPDGISGKTSRCRCGARQYDWRKFCSRKCYVDSFNEGMKEQFERWKASGAQAEHSKHGLRQSYKDLMIEEVEYRCPRCGWGTRNEYLDKVILTINHIDGDSTNNRYDNLEVLCYNCHTLTPKFGGLDARP